MNNRYLCRGKRKDNGEWVCGYYVFQRNLSVIGNIHDDGWSEVER